MRRETTVYRGFTLVEIIIVMMIVSIISLVAVPMLSDAASFQVSTAANIIASDLEYAKSIAITNGSVYSVVFDLSAESYQINDSSGNVISHPVHVGADYVIDFANDSRLNQVDILATSLGPTSTIKFDYLGTPLDVSGNGINSGWIKLSAGEHNMYINIEPITGYISID